MGITSMREMKIRYKDGNDVKDYTVQPHLLGKFKSTGSIILSAYDVTDSVGGGSWKSFKVGNISSAELTDDSFDFTAPSYNPKDKRMETIICSIPSVI